MEKCAREDSNFHILSEYQPLKLARLPIPPRAQMNDVKIKKVKLLLLNFFVTGLGLEPRTLSLKGRCSTN